MKLKLKSSWEMLLVLAIIIIGIIITTLAAMRNKDKQLISSSIGDDADLSENGSTSDSAKRPFVQPVKANGHSFPSGLGPRGTTERPLNGRTSKFDESQDFDNINHDNVYQQHDNPSHQAASSANRDSQGAKVNSNVDYIHPSYRDDIRTPRTVQNIKSDSNNNNNPYQPSYHKASIHNDIEDLMAASILKSFNNSLLKDFSSTSAATPQPQPSLMSSLDSNNQLNRNIPRDNNVDYRGELPDSTNLFNLTGTSAPPLTLPLPTTAILNELIGLSRKHHQQQNNNILLQSNTSQQSRPPQSPLSRLNQLIDDKLALLQLGGGNSLASGNPSPYETSESNQLFFRTPASNEIRSLVERNIPGGLPGYAAPKGTTFLTIPFDQGGTSSQTEAQNRNADFVADVSGFVRESNNQPQQQNFITKSSANDYQQSQQQDPQGSQASSSNVHENLQVGSNDIIDQQMSNNDQSGNNNINNSNNNLNAQSNQLDEGSVNSILNSSPVQIPQIAQSTQDSSMRNNYLEQHQSQLHHQQQQTNQTPMQQQLQAISNNRFINQNSIDNNQLSSNARYITPQSNRNWQPPYTMPINSNVASHINNQESRSQNNKFINNVNNIIDTNSNQAIASRQTQQQNMVHTFLNPVSDQNYLASNSFIGNQIQPPNQFSFRQATQTQPQINVPHPSDNNNFPEQMLTTVPMQNQVSSSQQAQQNYNMNLRRMAGNNFNQESSSRNSIDSNNIQVKSRRRRSISQLTDKFDNSKRSSNNSTRQKSTLKPSHLESASSNKETSLSLADDVLVHRPTSTAQKKSYQERDRDRMDEMTSERDMVDDEEARPLSIVGLDGQPSDYKSFGRLGQYGRQNPQPAQSSPANQHTGDFDRNNQFVQLVSRGTKKKDLYSDLQKHHQERQKSNKYFRYGSQSKRRNQKRKKNATNKSKYNGVEPKASGSDLLTKLLDTASTNDELEEDLDEDDDTSEKRREEMEDANFGIPADNDEQNNSQDNQDADRQTNIDGSPGVISSGSHDNEAYARKHQQRQDIAFYGHPGEETRQLKYGILGSGNYEVINGGIYPEADESTAAVNSVANYVRKPMVSRPGGLLMPNGLVMETANGQLQAHSGLIESTEGERMLKDNPNPLLELIDTNSGQMFDPNILNGIGSSGSTSSSLHHSGERLNNNNNNNSQRQSSSETHKQQPDLDLQHHQKQQQSQQNQLTTSNKQNRNRGILLGFQGYDDFKQKMLNSGHRQQQTNSILDRFMPSSDDIDGKQNNRNQLQQQHLNNNHLISNNHQLLDRSTMSSLSRPQVDQGGKTSDDELYINNDVNENYNQQVKSEPNDDQKQQKSNKRINTGGSFSDDTITTNERMKNHNGRKQQSNIKKISHRISHTQNKLQMDSLSNKNNDDGFVEQQQNKRSMTEKSELIDNGENGANNNNNISNNKENKLVNDDDVNDKEQNGLSRSNDPINDTDDGEEKQKDSSSGDNKLHRSDFNRETKLSAGKFIDEQTESNGGHGGYVDGNNKADSQGNLNNNNSYHNDYKDDDDTSSKTLYISRTNSKNDDNYNGNNLSHEEKGLNDGGLIVNNGNNNNKETDKLTKASSNDRIRSLYKQQKLLQQQQRHQQQAPTDDSGAIDNDDTHIDKEKSLGSSRTAGRSVAAKTQQQLYQHHKTTTRTNTASEDTINGRGDDGGGLNLSSSGKYTSYQILPSQKVTIFSDQDLDSSATEENQPAMSLLL